MKGVWLAIFLVTRLIILAQVQDLNQAKEAVDTLFFSDIDLALDISESNIVPAKSIKDTMLITYFLDQAGELNRKKGNYDKAIQQLTKCLVYKVNWENLKDLSLTHNNLGKTYINVGQYDLAAYHLIEALKLMETSGNLMGQGFYLNNLAALYDLQHNYSKALFYYEKSLAIKMQIADSTGMAASYVNLGITYQNLGNSEKAIDFNHQAYTIYSKFDYPTKSARCLHNISVGYGAKDDFSKALEFGRAAYAYDAKNEDEYLRTSIINNLAQTFLKADMIDSAEHYVYLAKSMATASNSFKNLKDVHETLTQLEEKKGNYEKALFYHRIKESYEDSLINEENIYAVADMEGKYQHQKNLRIIKEGELAVLQKEKVIDKQKFNILLWTTISVILLITVGIVMGLYFLKRKNTELLEGQLVLIQERNSALKKFNENVEQELSKTQLTLNEKEELLDNVFKSGNKKELPPELLSLSKRETEVLAHLALGWSDNQLAEGLYISKSTVKTHLRRIYSKLLVKGRAEAVAIAYRYDIIGETVAEKEN